MPHFSRELIDNPSLNFRSTAYSAQLPISERARTRIGKGGAEIPPGVTIHEDGSATVSFFAPEAGFLTARCGNTDYPMARADSGCWRTVIPYIGAGLKPLSFLLDGSEVLNPMAPIGFGWSRPINYIEFPAEDSAFYLLQDVSHGSVVQEFFPSSVTGRVESCMVYLPPDYFSSRMDYPVLYLQHGHGENEKCWVYQGKVNFIMDNLIASGEAEACVIVMNNGMVSSSTDDGAACMDSSLLEKLLVSDCIPFIEKKLRIKSGKENRAMAGLSMGSMQTSITTLNHPELFDYVGIFSGFLFSLMEGEKSNSHIAAMDEPDFKNRYQLFFRAMGNQDGFRSVFEHDSAYMEARGLSPEAWDAHKIYRYPGEHEWQVWRMCLRDYARLIFKKGEQK